MSEQRHVVKRQVIELKIQGPGQASAFQDELSRAYRERIVPLIEQHCSRLSQPERVYRIERLELDLGELDSQNLAEDFAARFDAILGRELAEQIQIQDQAARRSGASPGAQSQLELFAFFARSGSLPWWADASRPGLLAENLAWLQSRAREAFARLLQELVREENVRRRLVNQYSDEQLLALCGLLVPAHQEAVQQDFRVLVRALQKVRSSKGAQTSGQRQAVWGTLLMAAGAEGQSASGTLEAFYRSAFRRVAAALGSKSMPETIAPGPSRRRVGRPAKLAFRAASRPAPPGSSPRSGKGAAKAARKAPVRVVWKEIRQITAATRRDGPGPARSALRKAPAAGSRKELARLIAALRQGAPGTAGSGGLPTDPTPVGKNGAPLPNSANLAKPKTIDLSFSEGDEYPVANAGLVLLWPFLARFFTRLGLLDDERRFTSGGARQRAAGLLQVVASKDSAPPEYLLPLNKLLCGLDVESVFEFGPDLLESEAQECENLLAAAIAQAPILHDMTPDGFRGSFLLRQGVLGARDGMGLLRVERQTYDIVLERFPWSWEWVRLPWMEAPLRVEW